MERSKFSIVFDTVEGWHVYYDGKKITKKGINSYGEALNLVNYKSFK